MKKWKKFILFSLCLCLCLGSFCSLKLIGKNVGNTVKAVEYPFDIEDLGDLTDDLTSFWDNQSYLSFNYAVGSFPFSQYDYSIDVRSNIYIEFNLTEAFWQNYTFWESFPSMSAGYYSGRHIIIGFDENDLEVRGYIQFNNYGGVRQLRFYDVGNVLITTFTPSNIGSYRINLTGFSQIISFAPENANIPNSTFEVFSSQTLATMYIPKLYTVYEYLCYVYDLGYDFGQNDFSSEHYDIGYERGYERGYDFGFSDGADAGAITIGSFVPSIFTAIGGFFGQLGNFEIAGVTLGTVFMFLTLAGILVWIVKSFFG